MTGAEQLQGFFLEVCRLFPDSYVNVTLDVSRHRPVMGQEYQPEGKYRFYVADFVSVEANTIPDLIERTKVALKASLETGAGNATRVLEVMASW